MLKIGFAQQDMTPLAPVMLGGYAARFHPSEGIHDPLYAKVCSVSDGAQRILFFSCDALAVMKDQYMRLRELCGQLYGERNLIIAATHDHSAPEVRLAGLTYKANLLWRQRILAQMAALAGQAMEKEQPMTVRFASRQVEGVTRSRRADDTDTDETLTVFAMYDEEETCRGLILNFSCHCTVLDASNYQITADYPAFLYKQLSEWYPNATILFTNGAAGNLNIGYSADASALGSDMGRLRSFSTAQQKAALLAEGVRLALVNAKVLRGPLVFRCTELALPVKSGLPSLVCLEKHLEQLQHEHGRADSRRRAEIEIELVYCRCIRDNLEEYPIEDKKIFTEMTLFLLGKCGFITYPGEMFSQIGKQIKKRLAHCGYTVAVCGYANGYFGYLPTRQAHAAGGYECETTLLHPDAEMEVLHTAEKLARPREDRE